MKPKKSFYSVIPATVRYDKNLSPAAILFYGEITALANEKGYCWASNDYFCELYEVSESTLRRWIKQLTDSGHIKSEIDQKENTKRKIYISEAPSIFERSSVQKRAEAPSKNAQHTILNNIGDINTNNGELELPLNTGNSGKEKAPGKRKIATPRPIEIFVTALPWNTSQFQKAWIDYRELRRDQFGKDYKTQKTEYAGLMKLVRLSSNNEDTAIEIIKQSIQEPWLGLFPLKSNENGSYIANNQKAPGAGPVPERGFDYRTDPL